MPLTDQGYDDGEIKSYANYSLIGVVNDHVDEFLNTWMIMMLY